jgi:hypothetical protein
LSFQQVLRVNLDASTRDSGAPSAPATAPSYTPDTGSPGLPASPAVTPASVATPAAPGPVAKPGKADAPAAGDNASQGSGADALLSTSAGRDISGEGSDASRSLSRSQRRQNDSDASSNLLPIQNLSALAPISFDLPTAVFNASNLSGLTSFATATANGDSPVVVHSLGYGLHRGVSVETESDTATTVNDIVTGARSHALSFDQVFTSAQVASVSFSAGFIWWLTRGGGLLTSMLMGVPAWRHVDLLPVLARNFDDEDEETGEPLPETAPHSPDDEVAKVAREAAAAADINVEGLFEPRSATSARRHASE